MRSNFLRKARSRLKGVEWLRRAVARARTAGFDERSRALNLARKLMDRDNFNGAAACLENLSAKNARVWKMLLACTFTAHRFEDVISTYETMPAPSKQDPLCLHLYLLAAANLNQTETVVEIIEEVLKEPDRVETSGFFLKTRAFAERLGPETHRAAVERILRDAEVLALDQFDLVLKCAHDLGEMRWEMEARELEAALAKAAGGDASRGRKLALLRAQAHFRRGRFDLQLTTINEILGQQGLHSIDLKVAGAPLSCDNLQTLRVSDPVVGPLVSVLVPAFNSERSIGYALDSLRGQTYQNIEIIVVDDASDDGTASVVSSVAAKDPRVRLRSLGRNSGVFVARNVALAAASGEFVTNQDADDWAHPQKIATAVAELQRDRKIIATWVEHVRCSKERGFRALSGYIRPDASSLLFRRQAVIDRMGWYDSVRAAGDGEFHLRMERVFGQGSIRRLEKLLSFVDWSDASLSGGGEFRIDDDLGLFSPARSEYRRAFGLWHETASHLYVPYPMEKRPFPAPASLLS